MKRKELHIDLESYSEVNIIKQGAYRYAADPSTEILMLGWAIDDAPVSVWEASDGDFPKPLWDALYDENVLVWAYNAQFERIMLRDVWNIHIPRERWRCSQVLANSYGFTGGLDEILRQTGAKETKQEDGKALIRLFCMPQKTGQRIRRNDAIKQWHQFKGYCRQDVAVARRLNDRLHDIVEWKHYALDQKINDRGIPVDLPLIAAMAKRADSTKTALEISLKCVTGLQNPGSASQFKAWLAAEGVDVRNMRRETMERLLTTALDPGTKVVIEQRMEFTKSSTAKLDAFERIRVKDRIKGAFQFKGASRTARWAGRGIQPQNLPRPRIDDPDTASDILLNTSDFSMYYPDTMTALSSMIRGLISTGKKPMTVVDLGSIESRVAGWVTGCRTINDIFESKLDQYIEYGKIVFNKQVISKHERFICKPAVLGCQYMLGGYGLQQYALGMGVNFALKEAFSHVRMYRQWCPEIPAWWHASQDTIFELLQDCKGRHALGPHLSVDMAGSFMRIHLPSGRKVYYLDPRAEVRPIVWVDESGTKQSSDIETLTFMGMDQNTKKWCRISAHPGHILENVVQAIARDILVTGMLRADAAGLNIFLHVHDEIGIEGDQYDQLVECMTKPIKWAPGLLLDAAGYTATRYRKD